LAFSRSFLISYTQFSNQIDITPYQNGDNEKTDVTRHGAADFASPARKRVPTLFRDWATSGFDSTCCSSERVRRMEEAGIITG
jgi:hypothetical protein